MAFDTSSDEGPEYDIWLHLQTGIDAATMELDALDESQREALEWIAKALVQGRDQLAIRPKSVEAQLLPVDDTLLQNRWIRFAVQLEIAGRGIERSEGALKRFVKLRPAITRRGIPVRAESYVREVIETFAFGFDAACIALSCSAFEQVMKDELVRKEVYTEPQLRREQPTAYTLLAKARQNGVLSSSGDAAARLIEKRNNVMHKFLYDGKVSERQALDAIAELIEVLADTLGDAPDSR